MPTAAARARIIKRIHQLLDENEPQVQKAFLDSAARIVDDAVIKDLVAFIARGDIEGAVRSLQIDAQAFAALDQALVSAYARAGTDTADNLPAITDRSGARIVIRFGVRNPRAEAWARDHVGGLIRNITTDQLTAVRETISSGLAAGRNPRSTSLDVIGRVNRATGRREGGIIGLTSRHASTVQNARQALLQGDTEGMRSYLGLARRDKRFDATVLRALREERGVSADMVDRITGRLSDRYLALRGETISRSETLTAVNAGRQEAFAQGLEATGYTEQDVEREWSSTGDNKVRDTHRAMDGQTVQGLNSVYNSPSGAVLRYPGDPSAPAAERIQCRCIEIIRLNFFGNIAEG